MHQAAELTKVHAHSLISVQFSLRWRCAAAGHAEIYHFPKFNVWRDLNRLPQTLQHEILDRPCGHSAGKSFAPGVLVPPWSASNLVRIRDHQFNRHWRKHTPVEPRLGRFYPRGILQAADNVFRSDLHPARLIEIAGEQLVFDLNHPLARYTTDLALQIGDIVPTGDEHGGRCTEVLEEITDGPGIQARYGDLATDFFSDHPFRRLDPTPDQVFYSMPRMLNHLDAVAQQQVRECYAGLLKPGSHVLDLMSSFNSHLPESVWPAHVTGLGMNREELEANPLLDEILVQDLNTDVVLPFSSASFDAVVCTVSVEYLTQPSGIFREVARVLRPGGLFAVTFSNRWFPPKVIDIWHNLHEFERTALVLEYFLRSGRFDNLETLSVRGLSRPEDDRHIRASIFSDPIHAVWGYRRS